MTDEQMRRVIAREIVLGTPICWVEPYRDRSPGGPHKWRGRCPYCYRNHRYILEPNRSRCSYSRNNPVLVLDARRLLPLIES